MDLPAVKQRTWFYEFELPDGSVTRTDIPAEVRRIHASRRDKLRRVIGEKVPDAAALTALDLASHEGFFSLELARHFREVRGLEVRPESREAAEGITAALGVRNVGYAAADLQKMEFDAAHQADFVLLYGLLYHVENPVHVLRLACSLARTHLLIETQIFPYDVSGRMEDGHYAWQRPVVGVFGLAPDYAANREGGSTDVALVPSLNALLFLMKSFGFGETEVLSSGPDDYEQFARGSRVVVYGKRTA